MILGNGSQVVLLGPPGCGKTTSLLLGVEKFLEQGIEPERIAFVSFTRKAIREAVDRACEKFTIKQEQFPLFKTIHSLCYHQLGLTKDDVLGRVQYMEIGRSLGLQFTGYHDEDGTGLPAGGTLGDKMLFVYELSRVSLMTQEQGYNDFCHDRSFSWHHFKQFFTAIDQYRWKHSMLDFTAMLENFVDRGTPVDAEVAIVDEAQDLSSLQWAVLRTAFSNARTVYIAGDDDQAIYKWGGADVKSFLKLEGTHVVLNKSYRIPRTVHTLAGELIAKVATRFEKKFAPRAEEGSVEYLAHVDQIDLSTEGTWMLLARNIFQLEVLEECVRQQGLTFISRGGNPSVKKASTRAIVTWEQLRKGASCTGGDIQAMYDFLKVGSGVKRGFKGLSKIDTEAEYTMAELVSSWGLLREDEWYTALEGISEDEREYYRAVMRRGGVKAIRETPRILVNTIHGVKGGEADNVVVLTDLARRTYEQYQADPDDERRVFYVGATRAKKHLKIVMPTSSQFFTF